MKTIGYAGIVVALLLSAMGCSDDQADRTVGTDDDETQAQTRPAPAKSVHRPTTSKPSTQPGKPVVKPPSQSPASGKPIDYTKWPFDDKEAKRRQEETAAKLKIKTTIALDLGKGVTMKLALIPPGTFQMGFGLSAAQTAEKYGGKANYYTSEHPQHKVTLSKSLYLSVTEVTQAQWQVVMNTKPWFVAVPDFRLGAENAASRIQLG